MKHFYLSNLKVAVLALATISCGSMLAQNNESKKNSKEEGNRNVMLNAASANGPREIQIGLPSADVNVQENGLPVTYATNPHRFRRQLSPPVTSDMQ